MKTISYSRQNITKSDIDSVIEVLKGDLITQGKYIELFENNLNLLSLNFFKIFRLPSVELLSQKITSKFLYDWLIMLNIAFFKYFSPL